MRCARSARRDPSVITTELDAEKMNKLLSDLLRHVAREIEHDQRAVVGLKVAFRSDAEPTPGFALELDRVEPNRAKHSQLVQ